MMPPIPFNYKRGADNVVAPDYAVRMAEEDRAARAWSVILPTTVIAAIAISCIAVWVYVGIHRRSEIQRIDREFKPGSLEWEFAMSNSGFGDEEIAAEEDRLGVWRS